jgi:hypothetical protein
MCENSSKLVTLAAANEENGTEICEKSSREFFARARAMHAGRSPQGTPDAEGVGGCSEAPRRAAEKPLLKNLCAKSTRRSPACKTGPEKSMNPSLRRRKKMLIGQFRKLRRLGTVHTLAEPRFSKAKPSPRQAFISKENFALAEMMRKKMLIGPKMTTWTITHTCRQTRIRSWTIKTILEF